MRAIATLLLVLGVSAQDSDWWDGAWKFRRPVKITNHLKGPLTAGYPVSVPFNPAFLGLDKKAKPDLDDLRVVYKNKEVPFILEHPSKEKTVVTFRLNEDMAMGATHTYHLYFGNANAPKAAHKKTDVYDFFDDYDTGIEFDKRIDKVFKDGHLVLTGAPSDTCSFKLGRVKPLESFELRMKLAYAVLAADAGQAQLAIHLRSRKPDKADAELDKKIDELVSKLGDDDYRVREETCRQLIDIGKAALPKIEKALKSTDDPEVKWRCEYLVAEIAKRSPIPEILVKYQFVAVGNKQPAFTVTTTIEGKTSTSPLTQMSEFSLQVTRMEKHGSVVIRTPGDQPVNLGTFQSTVDEITFDLSNLKGATLSLSELQVRRYLSDQGKPTFEIDVEESKK